MNRTNGMFQSFVPFVGVKYVLLFGFAHPFSLCFSCLCERFQEKCGVFLFVFVLAGFLFC